MSRFEKVSRWIINNAVLYFLVGGWNAGSFIADMTLKRYGYAGVDLFFAVGLIWLGVTLARKRRREAAEYQAATERAFAPPPPPPQPAVTYPTTTLQAMPTYPPTRLYYERERDRQV